MTAQRDALLTQVQQLGAQRETAQARQLTQSATAQLAEAQQQAGRMKQQWPTLDKTVTADKATIQARLSDLAKLTGADAGAGGVAR